jgi:adenylate cyclase
MSPSRVEPEWAMVTLLFADIRGFTAFADRSSAREAVDYLNDFFALAVPTIADQGGRVNKLLGDGFLAVFATPDHADRALAAGTELLDAAGGLCRVGVGINSGLVLVGTIGAGDVVEVGVIGDPVNVAARVQDATRELGEPLLLTEATRCLLDAEPELRPCGNLSLRGKGEPVAVYALPTDFVTLPGRPTRTKEPRWQH